MLGPFFRPLRHAVRAPNEPMARETPPSTRSRLAQRAATVELRPRWAVSSWRWLQEASSVCRARWRRCVGRSRSFLSTIVARRPTAERTDGSRNAAVDTFAAGAALTTELPPRWAVLGWRRLQQVSVVCRARRQRCVGRSRSFLSTIRACHPSTKRTDGSRNTTIYTFAARAALNTELPPRWAVLGLVSAARGECSVLSSAAVVRGSS